MYVCIPCACLLSKMARRGHWVPYNWSYRPVRILWVTRGLWKQTVHFCSNLAIPGASLQDVTRKGAVLGQSQFLRKWLDEPEFNHTVTITSLLLNVQSYLRSLGVGLCSQTEYTLKTYGMITSTSNCVVDPWNALRETIHILITKNNYR